jgi:hypothetical protein
MTDNCYYTIVSNENSISIRRKYFAAYCDLPIEDIKAKSTWICNGNADILELIQIYSKHYKSKETQVFKPPPYKIGAPLSNYLPEWDIKFMEQISIANIRNFIEVASELHFTALCDKLSLYAAFRICTHGELDFLDL